MLGDRKEIVKCYGGNRKEIMLCMGTVIDTVIKITRATIDLYGEDTFPFNFVVSRQGLAGI